MSSISEAVMAISTLSGFVAAELVTLPTETVSSLNSTLMMASPVDKIVSVAKALGAVIDDETIDGPKKDQFFKTALACATLAQTNQWHTGGDEAFQTLLSEVITKSNAALEV